jgi:hypothetical protein
VQRSRSATSKPILLADWMATISSPVIPWVRERLNSSLARDPTPVLALLHLGGDERLAADPTSGRIPYGIASRSTSSEVYFSSSTASPVSARGLAAATEAWRRLSSDRQRDRLNFPEWFREIRRRIADYCGSPDVDCVLSGSGTEIELLTLAIVSAVLERPISNIVVAPPETGRGVITAARGSHFLNTTPLGERVLMGARLAGWEGADLRACGVDIRSRNGDLRPALEIDEEIWERATEALSQGRGVILHLLDVSKTGQGGLSCEMAKRIVTLAPGRVFVLADCCQLRSSPARIKSLLECGFLVALTGSKFAGGPPFSGALLVPGMLLDRMNASALPAGLGAYTCVHDWPLRMIPWIAPIAAGEANIGLGLRWIAALSEMEQFKTVPMPLVSEIQARFRAETACGATRIQGLRMLTEDGRGGAEWAQTIIPIILPRLQGSRSSQERAIAVHRALRAPQEGDPSGSGRGFHLGQPVVCGPDAALRVCLSAPMINDVVDHIKSGESFEDAFAPVAHDLRDLFDKWARFGHRSDATIDRRLSRARLEGRRRADPAMQLRTPAKRLA